MLRSDVAFSGAVTRRSLSSSRRASQAPRFDSVVRHKTRRQGARDLIATVARPRRASARRRCDIGLATPLDDLAAADAIEAVDDRGVAPGAAVDAVAQS